MKKKVLIIVALLSLSIFSIGCTSQTNGGSKDSKIEELQNQIKSHEKNVGELQEKISAYELRIKYLNEEKDEYKKFIDSSIKYFSEKELLDLAKNEWSYKISVDEKPIESNGALEIDKSNFNIAYSETRNTFPALPPEIHERGSISGNFFDHLKFLDKQPGSTQQTDGTVVQGMIYEFKNIQKGTVIKLEVSDELKGRLGLQTNIISIHVK